METQNMMDEALNSFKKLKTGDIVTGVVVGVSDTEVTLDLNTYCEGIIRIDELSNDPKFSIKSIKTGDEITAVVISEDDGNGNILLSSKQAADELAWDKLQQMMDDGTVLTLKVGGIVNAGVIVYVEGIRGFIPASQLSLNYVEDLNPWLNQTVEAKIITVFYPPKLLQSKKQLKIKQPKSTAYRLAMYLQVLLKILQIMAHLLIWAMGCQVLYTSHRLALNV